MVDVEVELLEGRHQLRLLADLRANWDELSRRRVDEVPVRRHLRNEQVGWVCEAGTSKREQRDCPRYEREREHESSLHNSPLSVATRARSMRARDGAVSVARDS